MTEFRDKFPDWKIERDSYYGELFRQHGLSVVLDAGFFYDNDEINRNLEDSADVLCTPVAFLQEPINNPCILLTTGSLCPVHYGHIQMMEAAKLELEQQGFNVIGGYLSPGHDEYVKDKVTTEWIPVHQRISLIKEATRDHKWLNVDPWEGVFNKVAVNFTDVIDRLQLYIKKHLGKDIPIVYVCGGDNSYFAKTFDNKGYCVVVSRPGYRPQRLPQPNNRVFLTEGSADVSSTSLRKSNHFSQTRKNLRIRVDDSSPQELRVAERLITRFSKTTTYTIADQQDVFDTILKTGDIVSLDTELKGGHKLGISRHYDLLGATRLRYGNRPGDLSLDEQINKLSISECILFDDDIHTGGTIRFVKKKLEEENIKVSAVTSLNIADSKTDEIADARDFLFGLHPNGGLVIQLPDGNLTRIPYLYPYVCPFLRASISDPLKFSIEMWELNAEFHKNLKTKIADVKYLYNFAKYLGYGLEKSLYEICLEHAKLLITFQN